MMRNAVCAKARIAVSSLLPGPTRSCRAQLLQASRRQRSGWSEATGGSSAGMSGERGSSGGGWQNKAFSVSASLGSFFSA